MRLLLFPRVLTPRAANAVIYRGLVDALRARGLEVTVAVTRWDGSPEEAGRLGIEVLRHSRAWDPVARLASPLLRGRQPLQAGAALRRWLASNRGRFDVLHAEDVYPGGAALALAARLAGAERAALVLKPMGEDVLVHAPSRYGFRRYPVPRALVASTLHRADGVRVTSPLVAETLAGMRIRGVTREVPVSVAPETVAAARRDPRERVRFRSEARTVVDARHDTGGRGLVLALGRLHPFKGLDVLVRAMVRVPDARLLIAGPSLHVPGLGDTGRRLRDLAAELGVEERTELIGPLPPQEARRYLAAADAVAIPSHVESHNKVCIEAAAAGTPFVVTETTGVAPRVTPGVGLVVPPGSPPALAEALGRILDGSSRHAPAAATEFVERFAPDRIAADLEELYREAISVAGRRSSGASGGGSADRR